MSILEIYNYFINDIYHMDCKINFEECELAILRSAIDSIDKEKGRKKINNPEIKKIIEIVENFLKKKN